MENLNKIINLIKEIDECLDAYEYNGYTYEEYKKDIDRGIRGNKGLRNLIKYNSSGSHVWNDWMQECLDNCKKQVNNIYTSKKNNTKPLFDILDFSRLIKRIRETRDTFKKNTDNYSLYPIQSETIGNNLTIIANYFEKYI